MKESTIQSFLQLLSLIANVEHGEISVRARQIIRSVLARGSRPEVVDGYMAAFDEMLARDHKVDVAKKGGKQSRKKRSSQSVKALVVCERNNELLVQHEKVRIIARLIEFANEDGIISKKELEFLTVVRDAFNIDKGEFEDIKALVLDSWTEGVRKDKLLILSGKDYKTEGDEKQMLWKSLQGRLAALFIQSSNFFIIKYDGPDILHKNSMVMKPGIIEIFDNDSFIRGAKIAPVYFNTLKSRFIQDSISKGLSFVAKSVDYKFRNSINGIQEFSVLAEAGDLLGIMGGSGVGKSTLLNVFNGNIRPGKGEILINGTDIYREAEKLEGIIGFIPQDDLLIDDLTVFQNLYYNAKLCFRDVSERGILKIVAKVLKDLSLRDVKHLKVGSPREKIISGGQRKRLNIGLELLREPSVLFVDEPTSGLSSQDAESVMWLLKKQAVSGKIVFVNIHQPSSNIYKLFNKILVMDKGGYVIFQGDPLDAQVYFKKANDIMNADESQCEICGNVNSEQILEIVETKLVNEYGKFTDIRKFRPGDWNDKYKEKIESKLDFPVKKMPLPDINFRVPSKWKQFLIFLIRDIRAKMENRQYILITLLEAPLLAFVIAYFTKYFAGTADDPEVYVFSMNVNMVSYIFMAVIVSLFLGMILSAEEIIKDALILKRESFLNLSRFSYINSKIVIVMGISALQMLMFVLMANSMLEIKGMTFKYWFLLFSAASMANLIGLNISSALKTVASIYIIIPLILVPQILFSGTVVSFNNLRTLRKHTEAVPPVGDLMISRWAFEALAVEQFRNNKFQKNFFYQDAAMSRAEFKTSYLLPRLRAILNEAMNLSLQDGNSELINYKLLMVKTEMEELADETAGLFPPGFVKGMATDRLDEGMNNYLQTYIDTADFVYNSMYNAASQEKDYLLRRLRTEVGGQQALLKLQNDYHNKSIADLVLNRNSLKKITEYDGRLIQRMDPIYEFPVSKIGRAHMYAPVKRLGQYEIDTYWFNLFVIWMFSLFAYVILYYDLIKKAIRALDMYKTG